MKKTCEHKPYVGDLGQPLDTAAQKAEVGFGMAALAIAVGFVIGLVVWAVFWASSALTELLWIDGRASLESALSKAGIASWWLPVAFCGIGGLVIGLWTRFFGGQPESLENVMASVKTTGGYQLEHPGAGIVGFLLPLVFGGSIGPEAGLTGIIAAACTRIGNSLKAAGIRVKQITDVTVSAALSAVFASPFVGVVAAAEDSMPALDPNDYEFRRKVKLVLYTASALGAIIGIALFTSVFGKESGLPHFDGVTPGANKLWWALPCILLGYLATLIYHTASTGFAKLDARLGDHPVAKPCCHSQMIPWDNQTYNLCDYSIQKHSDDHILQYGIVCLTHVVSFLPVQFLFLSSGSSFACLASTHALRRPANTPTITKGIKTGKETFFSSHVPKKVHSKMGTSILIPN